MTFMKSALIASLALAGLANAQTYVIDSGHTHARFAIDHMNTSTNQGGFYNLTGEVQFDPAKKTGAIDITIPMNSLSTGIGAFDEHLKSAEFFNVAAHPTANFKSTKWHFRGGKVRKVDGILTMMGKSHPVTLTAKKFNCYDSPMLKTEVCGGDFEATIDRTLWGINTYVDFGVTKFVKLNIQVEAGKK